VKKTITQKYVAEIIDTNEKSYFDYISGYTVNVEVYKVLKRSIGLTIEEAISNLENDYLEFPLGDLWWDKKSNNSFIRI
jgi:hypothetical protein